MIRLDSLAGVTLFWALVACAAWVGYVSAVAMLGVREKLSARLVAASVAALWLLAALFQWTLHLQAFNRFTVTIAGGVVCAVPLLVPGVGIRTAAAARRDRRRLRVFNARARRSRASILLLVPLSAAGYRFLLALPEPPLAWDALTYHLLKAGRWVRNGHLSPEEAPNAWSYYEYFPPVGDSYWAWAMLPVSNDSMLPFANLGIWLVGLLAVYALGLHFGARRMPAVAAAVAVGFSPVVFNQIVSCYVDNLLLALLMAGLLFLDRAWRQRSWPDALLACAALGLAVGTKSSAIALAVPAVTALGARFLYRPRGSFRQAALQAIGCLSALLIAAPSMVRAFLERGSPLYPFQVRIAGFTLPGNEQLAWVLAGKPDAPGDLVTGVESVFSTLLEVCIGSDVGATQILGLGSAPVVVLAWGGLMVARRDWFSRGAICLLVFLVAAPVLSDEVLAYRQVWMSTLPRFLMPGYAALVVWLAARGGRWGLIMVLLAALLNFCSLNPGHWETAHTELAASAGSVALTLCALHGAARVLLPVSAWRRRLLWVSLPAAGIVIGSFLPELRRVSRYGFYQAAARRAGTEERQMLEYWPIWKSVDGEVPLRIALTAGWTGDGHNVFASPLLGSRLQNEVVYIPISTDGSIKNYLSVGDQQRQGDFAAWLERLRARRIDVIVAYGPAPLEMIWMKEHTQWFEPYSESVDGTSRAFRLLVGHGARPR